MSKTFESEQVEVLNPRESSDFIAKMSSNVIINHSKLYEFSESLYKALEEKELRLMGVTEHETFPVDLNEKDSINFIFFLDTLNFCFWSKKSEPKWVVESEGKEYTGFYALTAALGNAVKDNVKIYDPRVYSNFNMNNVLKLLQGKNNRHINLAGHRLKCIHETGKTLLEKYDGDFTNCIKIADKSAEKLLEIIVTDFPCFNDSAVYNGKRVSFHKRAQILIAHIWSFNFGKGISEFKDIDVITMCADYRVPQVILHFGLMRYGKKLLRKIQCDSILPSGSEEEVEIRGCSVKIVELLLGHLNRLNEEKNTSYYCNSIMIDNYLWSFRKKEAENLKNIPYHKTYSIHY